MGVVGDGRLGVPAERVRDRPETRAPSAYWGVASRGERGQVALALHVSPIGGPERGASACPHWCSREGHVGKGG